MATDAAVKQALALLASNPAGAEAAARAILDTAPEDGEALAVLGAALRARGSLDAALAVLEPLVARDGASWMAPFELARVRLALGRSRDAVAPLRRAVALNPGLAPAWRWLGDILMFSGDVAAAQTAYDRQLIATLRDPRLTGPAQALTEGRLDEAEEQLRAVLAVDPAALAAVHLFGEVLARQGRLADAEAVLEQCVAQAPAFDPARQAYAAVLFGSGKLIPALAQIDRLLARDPGDNRNRMTRAAALTEIGDFAAAAQAAEALLRAFPDQPQGWLIHGHGLRTLGRIDEAIAAWRRCLDLDPARSEAYWNLANLKTYRFTAEDRAAIEAELARPGVAPEDAANLHFTLGKLHEDAGQPAQAFDHYARGNAIEHDARRYRAEDTTALVRRSKALFTPAFFDARAGWGAEAADPIFIVGMPRSGSTLVDQILASHPAVEGTRELQDIQTIADWVALQPGGAYPGPLAAMPRADAARLGRDYLDWTRVNRRQGRPRFTDKAPWNFLHIGLIHIILPNARIIDVRRHPLGCGLSIFKQHFAQGWDFSYDLADIGRYYADYVDLMAHMDAVLPGRVHRVIYEDLVADTEAEVRRLLTYLDLPFDPACLRFFDNPRAVATPSSEQVRRPITTEAVDHWRTFEPWLDPLKVALGPVLNAYPAAPAPS
jgi:tetratricopeptide (TPR) repeat protein